MKTDYKQGDRVSIVTNAPGMVTNNYIGHKATVNENQQTENLPLNIAIGKTNYDCGYENVKPYNH